MKILVVQDRLRNGGTERQSILLANSFQKAGHAVELITFRPGGELRPAVGTVPCRSLQRIDLGLDWFAPGLKRTVRRLQPEVVLCMGRMANSHAAAVKRSIPASAVVGTMRTGKRLSGAFRRSLAAVDAVVANSAAAQHVLVKDYKLPVGKVTVIHNALVFPPREPVDTKARQAFRSVQGATDATCVFVCAAMFRPEKNHSELIELSARLTGDWQLWLIGDGPTRSSCAAVARRLGVGARVRFFGFQSDPRWFYLCADAATLASKSESLPNFLIEAHAHGLPSVAYDVGGVAECGGRAIALGDQGKFLQALQELQAKPAHRWEVGAAVAAWTREQFSVERQTQCHLELFEQLLSTKR